MDMSTPTPLEQAKALLGEHYPNYVVIAQEENNPTEYELVYSCPYAAKGLMDSAVKYHSTYLEGGTVEEIDWEWEEIDDSDDIDDIVD